MKFKVAHLYKITSTEIHYTTIEADSLAKAEYMALDKCDGYESSKQIKETEELMRSEVKETK